MSKKTKYYLLFILISVTILTKIFTPKIFYIGGGSCYQGITAFIIHFFLLLCTILNVLAIILLSLSKIGVSKTFNIIAIAIWSLGMIIHSLDQTITDGLIVISYFTPFLIVSILIFLMIKKINKLEL
ncbi:hypothetical protein [Flavobacterium hungaricum]|uniref:DoxX-like family protein n=1 Tax=Flavobacterium hungaricum TaxID=2082725 RepID=A0ABR9TKM6_9FLAO|nr:hypothetical protein [Flavobacterium hungaricum]MBE8725912.1 hypothetical protein [Flavobacterium hungaricum]